ncbi:hypothetical protein Pelo_7368 [Pelomyxa schiedti]|nr:hypothetical protein Pelo_7368 [Pelomyxa schiedti]
MVTMPRGCGYGRLCGVAVTVMLCAAIGVMGFSTTRVTLWSDVEHCNDPYYAYGQFIYNPEAIDIPTVNSEECTLTSCEEGSSVEVECGTVYNLTLPQSNTYNLYNDEHCRGTPIGLYADPALWDPSEECKPYDECCLYPYEDAYFTVTCDTDYSLWVDVCYDSNCKDCETYVSEPYCYFIQGYKSEYGYLYYKSIPCTTPSTAGTSAVPLAILLLAAILLAALL